MYKKNDPVENILILLWTL